MKILPGEMYYGFGAFWGLDRNTGFPHQSVYDSKFLVIGLETVDLPDNQQFSAVTYALILHQGALGWTTAVTHKRYGGCVEWLSK